MFSVRPVVNEYYHTKIATQTRVLIAVINEPTGKDYYASHTCTLEIVPIVNLNIGYTKCVYERYRRGTSKNSDTTLIKLVTTDNSPLRCNEKGCLLRK